MKHTKECEKAVKQEYDYADNYAWYVVNFRRIKKEGAFFICLALLILWASFNLSEDLYSRKLEIVLRILVGIVLSAVGYVWSMYYFGKKKAHKKLKEHGVIKEEWLI